MEGEFPYRDQVDWMEVLYPDLFITEPKIEEEEIDCE